MPEQRRNIPVPAGFPYYSWRKMGDLVSIDGGVTAPRGFMAAAVHAGIKGAKPDLALLVSSAPAAVAGNFTTNSIQAAPVKLCKARLAGKVARAIVVNSGNANACAGPQGLADAERMGSVAAECLGISQDTVFVCSTGVIGVPLPMKKVEAGIRAAANSLSETGGHHAARAIMTTDTVEKEIAVEIAIEGSRARIGGMAKGAGMIAPNMATMLAFLTTDAAVAPDSLQQCLSSAVAESFNKITVDGDQSTNDTVLLMANGLAGNKPLTEASGGWRTFSDAVKHVTRQLALKIVKDAEGATKFVTVNVSGAASDRDARLVARAVANSLLVKTSWYGGDPNWGRLMDAIGYSGAQVKEELIGICYDDFCAVKNGIATSEASGSNLKKALAGKDIAVNIALNLGNGKDTVYTCDCSEEYVRINSQYVT